MFGGSSGGDLLQTSVSQSDLGLGPMARQSDQPLLSICEAESEEMSGHEREQHQNQKTTSDPKSSLPDDGVNVKPHHALLSICEAKLNEVNDREREQRQESDGRKRTYPTTCNPFGK